MQSKLTSEQVEELNRLRDYIRAALLGIHQANDNLFRLDVVSATDMAVRAGCPIEILSTRSVCEFTADEARAELGAIMEWVAASLRALAEEEQQQAEVADSLTPIERTMFAALQQHGGRMDVADLFPVVWKGERYRNTRAKRGRVHTTITRLKEKAQDYDVHFKGDDVILELITKRSRNC